MPVELIDAARNLFQQCLDDSPPDVFLEDYEFEHHVELIFRRILELQIEHCIALRVLCDNRLLRPAYGILRSVLENIATLLWITLDVERYAVLFEEGRQPNTKEILTRIGWEQEYERTFKFLSSFVHADLTHSDMYKNYDTEDGIVAPEVAPDGEMYILGTPDGYISLSINPMSPDEIEREYEPYLSAKVFDLAVVGMAKLYGSNAHAQHWWPITAITAFTEICSKNPNLGKLMLWNETQ